MGNILINLLPNEVKIADKISRKKILSFRISIGILVFFILTTATLILLGIRQNGEYQALTEKLKESKSSIANVQNNQTILSKLKYYLGLIDPIINQPNKSDQAFSLVTKLSPTDIQLQSLQIDKSGRSTLIGESPTIEGVNSLISNLTDPRANEDKLAKVTLNNFSLAKSGSFVFDLTLVLK